jgi:isopenicillin-N epimerase
VGNCHKWLCAPKGAGFLYVRPDRQEGIQPAVISHGYNQPRPGYSRFQDAFDWQGTVDPTAWLCVGEAIAFLASLLPGGIQAIMRRNHDLTAAATRMLAERLPLRPACPETMLGSMAAFILPPDADRNLMSDLDSLGPVSRTGNQLLEQHGIEVPVYHWPAPPQAILRISAHAYNDMGHYMRLADALQSLLKS